MKEDLLLINRGAIEEQFVGQQLLTLTNQREKGRIFFWSREARNSSAGVDFVTHVDATILPIKVKAGGTGRLKSLQIFLEENKLPLGVRISQQELSLEKGILTVPFYLMHQLPRLIKHTLQKGLW